MMSGLTLLLFEKNVLNVGAQIVEIKLLLEPAHQFSQVVCTSVSKVSMFDIRFGEYYC